MALTTQTNGNMLTWLIRRIKGSSLRPGLNGKLPTTQTSPYRIHVQAAINPENLEPLMLDPTLEPGFRGYVGCSRKGHQRTAQCCS